MAPTIDEINKVAFQPYLDGKIEVGDFFEKAAAPMHKFMVGQIGTSGIKEVALFVKLSKLKRPKNFDEVPMQVLIPAFMLSEIKKALS